MITHLNINTEIQEELDKDLISLFNRYSDFNLLENEMTKEELKKSFVETIQYKLKEIDNKFLFENLKTKE